MKIQETTFYEDLQKSKTLDLRDNRGKKHDLCYVLLSLTIGLLRKRDGCLSSLHRSMQNKNEALCNVLEIDIQPVISRSHLPVLLAKVDLATFENLLFRYYGIELSAEEKSWFSIDGKELRGSILKGDKRGEAIVMIVAHQTREVLSQDYYSGKKESEQPCVRAVLTQSEATTQKITSDALHLNPKTTSLIHRANGRFIIGLKENQEELLNDMKMCCTYLKPVNQLISTEKGHGRLEVRAYSQYDISTEYFDKRWDETMFKSLFKVVRTREELRTGKRSEETAFYISNGWASENSDKNYFHAIRNHWSVEVNNHIRDVTLKEDKLRTKKKSNQSMCST